MNRFTFATLSALSFGVYNFFVKLSADKLDPTIALMLIAGTSFLVAVLATLALKISGQALVFSRHDIWLPIIAGACAGIAEISYLFMFSRNTHLSIGTPIVIGGTMVVATLLGVLILKEQLTTIQGLGILCIIIGLTILSY